MSLATSPEAMTFPSRIMVTDPQISETSLRMCVEISRLTFLCFSSARVCLISIIPLGSSPDVGSSRMIVSGFGRSACARTTLCLIPLENSPIFLSRHSHILIVSRTSLARISISLESSP